MVRAGRVVRRRAASVAAVAGIAAALACGGGDRRASSPGAAALDPLDRCDPAPASGRAGEAGGARSTPPVAVHAGEPAPAGASSTRDPIAPAIAARRDDLLRCYVRAELEEPVGTLRIAARFTIGADGAVTDATASGQIAEDAEVARCVACVLGTVRFPPPADGATVVTYPLLFSGR